MKKMKMDLENASDMNDADEPAEHEVAHAADTLMQAEKIRKNKKLMPHVHAHLKQKHGDMGSLIDNMKAAKQSLADKQVADMGEMDDEKPKKKAY